MRLVTTRTAKSLTALSTEQLREWSSRRAIIPADVHGRGRGSPAQYSWQTILLLRVAVLLKDRFHLELHAHRGLFASLREGLAGTSFIRLWGCSIAIYNGIDWALLDADETSALRVDALIVRLDPHLVSLAAAFGIQTPARAGQLELFPARLLSAGGRTDPILLPQGQGRRPA